MKNYITYALIIMTSIIFNIDLCGQVKKYNLSGEYLGQEKPNHTPKIFAPGIISNTEEYEFGSVFSSDGNEFYYGVDISGKSEIRYMICKDNKWSKPKRGDFSYGFNCNDPFLSPDGNKLFFISDMPVDSSIFNKDFNIWYIEKENGGWSKPINAGKAINSDKNEYYISFTNEGTMYFASNKGTTDTTKWNYDIYYSEFKEGVFQKPIRMCDSINTSGYEADVFISPDENYIIFCSYRNDGFGQGDLYISFKENNVWSKAINMGENINTEGHELCPFVTADGKYFFYTSNKDIYWVDSGIIRSLKNKSR